MKLISLTRGKFAKVDDSVFDWLNQYNWHCSKVGYAERAALKHELKIGYPKKVKMHRFILGLIFQPLIVDHINQDKLDNTEQNLRTVTYRENLINKPHKQGKYSKFRGVSLILGKYWAAKIKLESGKTWNIGSFQTENEAALAYNQAAISVHKEFALLNVFERDKVDNTEEMK